MNTTIRYCLFALVVALSVQDAFAQFHKGDKFIGGGLSFEVRRSQIFPTTTHLGLQPQLGVFLSANDAIGITPILSINWAQSGHASRHSGGLSVFYRRYFSLSEKLYAHVGPSISYVTNLSSDYPHSDFAISLSPGLAYRLNDRWMFDVSLGGISYSRSKVQNDIGDEIKYGYFRANFSSDSIVSIIYLFPSKKP